MISDLNGTLGSRQFLNVANERTCFASCASTFKSTGLYLSSLKLGFVGTSNSSAVAFILKLFRRVFAPIFMHLPFLILINTFAKFSVLKILFHVIL